MIFELPVKVEIEVPVDLWEPINDPLPDAVTLLRNGDFERYRPLLTVESRELLQDASIQDVAGVVFQRFSQLATEVKLISQDIGGSGSVVQLAGGMFADSQGGFPLVQMAWLFDLREEESPRHWAFWLSLLAEPGYLDEFGSEIEGIIGSLRFSALDPTP